MYKVLLVEDEVLVREAIAQRIVWNKIGLTLLGACKNGKEAIEVIDREAPDIVLTDICMPYMDGMQLSKYLYERYPETKIIIFSGYNEFEYAKQALQYKVEEYLLKPVTAIELTELLMNIKAKLDKQRQEKEDIRKIRGSYYKHLSTIRSQVLNDLILGNRQEEEYKSEMEESGIKLNKKYFKVALIDIEILQLSDFNTGDNQNQSALLSFAIYNIAEEIITAQGVGVVFQQKDNRTVIIFESHLNQEFEKEVRLICRMIQDKIKNHLHCETFIGIGKRVDTLSKIYLSYEGAYEAVSYHYLYGYGEIISQDEVELSKKEMDASIYIEELLLQVKKQSYEGVYCILNKLLMEMRRAYLRKEEVFIVVQNIMIGANELLKLAGVERKTKEGKDEQWLREFEKKKNVKEAFQLVREYLERVIKQLYNLKADMSKKQAVLALDYIEKNYQNSELTLQVICHYLSVSPSYFSAILKKETGETFVELLTKKRMEKAQNLLRNTSLKNYEIAERVGFSDPHYFSQTFKKYTGKTPKKYAREGGDEL